MKNRQPISEAELVRRDYSHVPVRWGAQLPLPKPLRFCVVEGYGSEAFHRGSHPDGAIAYGIRGDDSEGVQFTLYFDFCLGCFISGDRLLARFHDGKWQALDSGRHFFRNATTLEDSVGGSVRLELFTDSGIEVQALTTYELIANTAVQVNFDAGSDNLLIGQAASFVVTGVACPEAYL